jgi:hypothetical protein
MNTCTQTFTGQQPQTGVTVDHCMKGERERKREREEERERERNNIKLLKVMSIFRSIEAKLI